MAATRGRQPDSVERRLLDEPQRFEFFQVVRLLQLLAREEAGPGCAASGRDIGRDATPSSEAVRLRANPSLGFPVTAVEGLSRPEDGELPAELTVAFFGLLGVAGTLPSHYTELVIRRARQRDHTLREFVGLLEHRALSLFYRAWEKYRPAMTFERANAAGDGDDPAAVAVSALSGRATDGQRGRLEISEDVFLRFSGHFARRTRPAVSLEAILGDYFEMPVRVEQFQGELLRLPVRERTALPSPAEPHGRHTRLGGTVVLGGHAFDAQGRYSVRVGPLKLETFRRLMPTGDLLRPLCQLARSFAGPELAFDVRPVLEAGEAPPLQLAADPPDSPRLGWNTWLRSEPVQSRFDGVRFSLDPA